MALFIVHRLVGLTLCFSSLFLFLGIIYVLFFDKNTPQVTGELVLTKLKNVFFAKWDDPEVVTLKHAWKSVIIKRLPDRSVYVLLEFPFLVLTSFYTLIRTRFHFFELLLFYRAAFWLFFLKDYTIYLYYCGPILVLTCLAGIPWVQNHFKRTYSPCLLKDLGWNIFIKTLMSQLGSGTKTLIAFGGACVGNEIVSPLVGQYRADNYANAVAAATEKVVEHNAVLERHGQTPQLLPVLDSKEYIRHCKDTDLIKEFMAGVNKGFQLTGPDDHLSVKSEVALDKPNDTSAVSGESKFPSNKAKLPSISKN